MSSTTRDVRGFGPDAPADLAGLVVDGQTLPFEEVPGDWFAARHGTGSVLIAVGDVVGCGADAAPVAAQLLDAFAREEPEAAPADTLAQLEEAVAGAPLLGTAVVARWADGVLEVATAGHPPLLVVNGHIEFLEVPPGLPLGLGGPRPTVRAALPAGATLVAYTDGVVERRRAGLEEGMGVLRRAALAEASAAAIIDASVAELGPAEDDVTVVVAHLR